MLSAHKTKHLPHPGTSHSNDRPQPFPRLLPQRGPLPRLLDVSLAPPPDGRPVLIPTLVLALALAPILVPTPPFRHPHINKRHLPPTALFFVKCENRNRRRNRPILPPSSARRRRARQGMERERMPLPFFFFTTSTTVHHHHHRVPSRLPGSFGRFAFHVSSFNPSLSHAT